MATAGKMNATLLKFIISGTTTVNATSRNFKVSMATRDTTNHDSGGWEESLGGTLSGSGSCEVWHEEGVATNFSTNFALITARTAVTVIWGTGVTGDKKYTASCFITDIEMSGGTEESVKCTFSVKTTGAITEATT